MVNVFVTIESCLKKVTIIVIFAEILRLQIVIYSMQLLTSVSL